MSLIPAFDIGVWNAWIPMLYFPLHPVMFLIADKLVGVGDISKKMKEPAYTKTEKRMNNAFMVLILLALIYSIFLPLKLGTIWLYIGLPVYFVGLIIFIVPMVNIATTPHGEPFTKGMYRFSRHPMYVGGQVAHLGVSIASASWVFLLFTIVLTVLTHFITKPEERGCVELYGDAYLEYMNRTPRWIGMPK